jgi:hypothetical protein
MIRMRKLFLALLFALPFMASAQNKSTLKPGKWYAEFAAQTAAIPFVFEVTNHNTSTQKRHHEIPKSQKRSQKTPDEYLLSIIKCIYTNLRS